jgi:hypothetical protein
MTKPIKVTDESTAEPVEVKRTTAEQRFYLPEYGTTVAAASIEEAVKIAKSNQKGASNG